VALNPPQRGLKAWIATADLHADPMLEELYAAARDPTTGELDNILAVHGLHPAGLKAHLELYRAVMRGTRTLRKVERELIALLVSRLNRCHY
jgi:alkylhydroperoxidase family enzyme